MTLQILLSTMNQKNIDLIYKMNINTDCVIINQCNLEEKKEYLINDKIIKFISCKKRGLSASRNDALKHASSEICLLADDDLEYVKNYSDIIIKNFKENNDIDIIVFQVEGKNGAFKTYPNKEKDIGYIRSLKISSVEIAFRLESIKRNNILFNELLGTGSKYKMGEENEFLFKCLRAGLKIKYIPIKIADLELGNSTWFNGFDKEYFFSRGAAFTAMSSIFYWVLILQFAIRHYKDYKNDIGIFQCLLYMFRGHKSYKIDRKEVIK
ncbi:glycosyltransferase family 2 protein [Clostridium perfringens]|nr:glycosyltransferase family 2 protein [Clostridium perfringens]